MSVPSVMRYMRLARQLPDADLSRIETTISFIRVADSILERFEKYFAKYKLTDGKFTLLLMFYVHEVDNSHVTPADLARKLGVTRATVTGLLDGLVKAELVTRETHPQDRRSLSIKLTDKGTEFMEQLIPDYFRQTQLLSSKLTTDEQQQLLNLLGKLYIGTALVN